ncbi:MAG: type II toxin-antitoxin system RelE/ParE family toxin [bacterium]
MYDFTVTNACKKDFKKIDRKAQKFIRYFCFPKILANPFIGAKLKGNNFENCFKFGIKFQSVDYRIIYKINNEKIFIVFIMISSRENVYKKLDQRI